MIKGPHHEHLLSVGRPDGKICSVCPVPRHGMGPKLLEEPVVRSLVKEEKVIICQEGHVAGDERCLLLRQRLPSRYFALLLVRHYTHLPRLRKSLIS